MDDRIDLSDARSDLVPSAVEEEGVDGLGGVKKKGGGSSTEALRRHKIKT